MKENLKTVEKNIQMACERAGRRREEVTLIAVSKTNPMERITEAIGLGVTDFGENKVQELISKMEGIGSHPNWHFIGHLQRNKVKSVVGKVAYIHSVDSLRLAEQIEAECAKRNIRQNILIEVNVAGEDSKFGVSEGEALDFIREIAQLKHINVRGLMTVAPYVDDPEENRVHFKCLRKLLVDINKKNVDNVDMNILSMGMTGDYEVAIEEGANMVRVGTGIFGTRI